MEAFLKGGKLPTSKPKDANQKSSKDARKARPLPWVEKVNRKTFNSTGNSCILYHFFFSIDQRKLMMLWSKRKFVLSSEIRCPVPICRICSCTDL